MPAARALTLLETLVSVSLFFVMLGAVVLCERTIRSAQPWAAARSEVDRMALVALEKVRLELKGARVVPPDDPAALAFYAPDRQPDGAVKIGPTGEAVFVSQPTTLAADSQGVLRAGNRRLAQLGEKGWVSFELREELNLLDVTLHAETSLVRELKGRIALPNQN